MNTTETETMTETTPPLLTPISKMLKAGNHRARVLNAQMTRNRNGKLSVELELELAERQVTHNMYCTSLAGTANTASQLEASFGLKSFKDVQSIVGQACSVRVEYEEYNGRTQAKVSYVNPISTVAAEDVDYNDLDSFFNTKEVAIEF